jgi:hypothetical protein
VSSAGADRTSDATWPARSMTAPAFAALGFSRSGRHRNAATCPPRRTARPAASSCSTRPASRSARGLLLTGRVATCARRGLYDCDRSHRHIMPGLQSGRSARHRRANAPQLRDAHPTILAQGADRFADRATSSGSGQAQSSSPPTSRSRSAAYTAARLGNTRLSARLTSPALSRPTDSSARIAWPSSRPSSSRLHGCLLDNPSAHRGCLDLPIARPRLPSTPQK